MTTPTAITKASLDLCVAARRRLVTDQGVVDSVGPPPGSTSAFDFWVFVRRCAVVVEGTSSVALILSLEGPWARPNPHNTARFPRLRCDIWADPTRSANGSHYADAEPRALAVFDAVDTVLHRTVGMDEVWGADSVADDPGWRVCGSSRVGFPEHLPVEDWEGGTMLVVSYGLVV